MILHIKQMPKFTPLEWRAFQKWQFTRLSFVELIPRLAHLLWELTTGWVKPTDEGLRCHISVTPGGETQLPGTTWQGPQCTQLYIHHHWPGFPTASVLSHPPFFSGEIKQSVGNCSQLPQSRSPAVTGPFLVLWLYSQCPTHGWPLHLYSRFCPAQGHCSNKSSSQHKSSPAAYR